MTAHSAALRLLTEGAILSDQLLTNYRRAALNARDRAMLDFAVKITLASPSCSQEDVDRLREVGWTDEDIMDIAEVAAMFNLTNRLVDALGWMPNPEYHSLGR